MKKVICILAAVAACGGAFGQSVSSADWGKTSAGDPVKVYTLKNDKSMEVKVIDYGAIITQILVPDRNGKLDDVVIGFDNIADYQTKSDYFGAVVGRYGNRIANGKFSIDGHQYSLEKNNNGHTLHSASSALNTKMWKGRAYTTKDAAVLELTTTSPDGDAGFPGTLNVAVTYTLSNDNTLTVNYKATTDKPTVCNLTQHSYFNLFGAGNGSILNHEVTINADAYTPVDKTLIPTGEIRSVEGTVFDFRKPKPVGSRIEFKDDQLEAGGGYDHNFVLNKNGDPKAMTFAVRVYEPVSGRQMEIFTTEPGVQFYSGNFLSGQIGKKGKAYRNRYGMCFETQHFPDSPNQPKFPSTILRPGQTYDTTTVFKFSVQ